MTAAPEAVAQGMPSADCSLKSSLANNYQISIKWQSVFNSRIATGEYQVALSLLCIRDAPGCDGDDGVCLAVLFIRSLDAVQSLQNRGLRAMRLLENPNFWYNAKQTN